MREDNTHRPRPNDVERILARFDSVDARFNSVDMRFDYIDARFNSVDARFDAIDARFNSVESRLQTLDARLTTLEDKVERRPQETRPVWEQVLSRLDGLDARMNSLEGEVRSGFRKAERQVGELYKDVLAVRADQRDLENRMDKLESEPAR